MGRRPVKEDVLFGCRERDGIHNRTLLAEEAEVACGNATGIHDPVVGIMDLGGLYCRADRDAKIGHAEDAVRAIERCCLRGFLFTGFCRLIILISKQGI